jgi:putative CocE/NonD family hydrolase
MALRRGLPLLVFALLAFHAGPALAADGCQEIAVTMSDGVRLDGWFIPAAAGGKAPVLWTMSPYTNTPCPGLITGMDVALRNKFNVVRLSYRGTGASEGVSDNWGPQTRKDVLEVGKWIVAQPWADGLVPAGTSAEGAWITFALDIPEVKATLWETSCADPLRGCIRNGGTLAGGIGALTEGVVAGYASGMQQRVQNGYASNPDPASQWVEQVPYIAPAYTDDTNTPYWQQRLGLQYLVGVHSPVMFTTDLYDFVPEGMYVAYEHTAAKYRWLDLGYGHASSRQEFTDGTPLNKLVFGPVRRFLEHFVFGADNGFEDEPRVTVVTNLGTPSGYERGEVLVRGESRWPLPKTRFTRLHLGEKALTSSAATTEASDTAPVVSVGPFGELRTTLVASGGFPQDQQNTLVTNAMDDLSPREAAGLTYTTPPLADDVELTGPVVAHLFASTTAPDFDWQVRLTDVHPDGRSSWISDGQLRASLRALDPARSRRDKHGDIIRPWYTFAAHETIPPNEVREYYVELGPTSNIFRAGDRIRFDIQPAADAYVDSARTGGAGILQIARGGAHDSSVLLPVIPHRCGHSVAPVSGLNPPADCAGKIRF